MSVAVITGAARGLGELLATRLAARGTKVALLGLEPAELARVAKTCGADARFWTVDVTNDKALAVVAAEVEAHYGQVDLVIANAGIATGGPVELSDPLVFNKVVQVNLLGSASTARAFMPALRRSKGYFFQVASLAAFCSSPLMAAYCASKAGVEAFAHCLRAEVAHYGVGVGVGYLSWTDTDMVRGADDHPALRELRAGLPYPANQTYALEPTVDRMIKGILKRKAAVYGQWWLPAMRFARPVIPAVVTRQASKLLKDIDARWAEAGNPGLVGAGGAANASEPTPQA